MSENAKNRKENFWLRTEDKLSGHPFKIIISVFILTVFFGYFLVTNTKINNDVSTMIPEGNPVKVFDDKTSQIFGSTAGIVIAVENPKGLMKLETLKKIRELSDRIEVIDNRILRDQLSGILEGFSEKERESVLILMNERLREVNSTQELQKLLQDDNVLFEYFWEQKTQEKVKNLAQETDKLKSIYRIFTRHTDENNKWRKRVRQVKSLTKVDYVFSQFTQTEKLNAFFNDLNIKPGAGIRFSGYVVETGLTELSGLRDYIQSSEFGREARLLGFEKTGIETIRKMKPQDLQKLLTLIQSAPKKIRVADLVDWDELKANPEREFFLLSERLRSWEIYRNTLYSPQNENSTLISVEMVPQLVKEERELLIKTVRETVNETLTGSGMNSYISGEPVITDLMGKYMVRDLKILFPIVLVIIGIFLYGAFRHWRGIALPMIAVVLSTIWTLGTIALLGASISVVSTVLPVLLVAVGSAYGIHIIHHYYEDRALGMDKHKALKKTIGEIGIAVVMAGVTTVVGFGSLASNTVIPLREFGIFAAIGVFYALIISLIFIPALLKVGRLPKRVARQHFSSEEELEKRNDKTGYFLEKLGHLTVSKKIWFILGFAVILGFAIVGTTRMKVEINSIEYFKKDTPVRVADRFIRQNFAGTSTLNLVIDTGKPNGILDTEFLKKVESIQQKLEAEETVGKVSSVVEFIKKMHQTMQYGDPDFYRIPRIVWNPDGTRKSFEDTGEKQQALSSILSSYLDQYSRDDTRRMVNQDRSMMKVALILETGSTIATAHLKDEIDGLVREMLGNDSQVNYSGINPLYLEMNNMIVEGQIFSILLSSLVVFLLVTIMQRSFFIGVLSIIPLGLAILINFGIMGFFGVHLDVATAIIASIAIGIGVDYTIHYLNGYLSALRRGKDRRTATVKTTVRSGRAILINAVSVAAGFLVLCFSSFLPLINVGWLIALTMLTTAFSALTLIPVFLNKIRLNNLTKSNKTKPEEIS
jgi:hydrophobe/amphiphile efflux-3 (HAE3) family protein